MVCGGVVDACVPCESIRRVWKSEVGVKWMCVFFLWLEFRTRRECVRVSLGPHLSLYIYVNVYFFPPLLNHRVNLLYSLNIPIPSSPTIPPAPSSF